MGRADAGDLSAAILEIFDGDGSHRGSEITPLKVEIDAPRKVAWCACKQTGKEPYCDGSHARI